MFAKVVNEGRNYNPHRRLDILMWMQNEEKLNKRAFRDTTAASICARYGASHPEVASSTCTLTCHKIS